MLKTLRRGIANAAREEEGHSGITTFQSVGCMTRACVQLGIYGLISDSWCWGNGRRRGDGDVQDRVQQLGGQEDQNRVHKRPACGVRRGEGVHHLQQVGRHASALRLPCPTGCFFFDSSIGIVCLDDLATLPYFVCLARSRLHCQRRWCGSASAVFET